MSQYQNSVTGVVREYPDGWLDRYVGTPKEQLWIPYEPPVVEPTAADRWQEKLAGRIDVNGISLAASEEVRNILTGQFSMVVGAVLLQVMPADTPQEIFDADGELHTMPASSLIQLLFSYGQQWTALHKEFAP